MPTPWDALYKQVLTRFFQQERVTVNTEVEVGRLPRTIDLALICSPEEAQRLAFSSPFTFLAQYNLLEFKSPSDPLTSAEYKRIMARTYLYMAEVGVDDLSLITVCAVTSGKPVKVLTKIPQLVKFSNVSDALYKSDTFPFYVLVVAELAIEEQNYPLLLFSKGEKRNQFLKELVRKGAIEYLRLAYQLYPDDVMEVFSMSKDFPTLEENIRVIIKDLGADRILREMQPQDIAQTIDAQKWTQIAQSIPVEQENALLRSLLLRHNRPEEIAHSIPNEQKDSLLRALLLERLSTEEVESILQNDGKKKS